jgi:hypothetical protein
MKIRFYITTYNNNEILNDWILKSLHESDYDRNNVEIFVIDNHSNVHINDEYSSFVKVLANNLRPDFSTGHLARNHNQAIINGFESLTNPKCDVVVSCQNDTKVLKNWYQTLCEAMKTYTFFTTGQGDQFQAFKAEGVRNIGLYDERFCNIQFQEADYFLRAYLYNKEKSSINDHIHGRLHNERFQIDVAMHNLVGPANITVKLMPPKAWDEPLDQLYIDGVQVDKSSPSVGSVTTPNLDLDTIGWIELPDNLPANEVYTFKIAYNIREARDIQIEVVGADGWGWARYNQVCPGAWLGEPIIEKTKTGCEREDLFHLGSRVWQNLSAKLFRQKWGDEMEWGGDWQDKNLDSQKCLVDNYVLYPYFEKDIIDPKGKRYIGI